MKSLFTAVAPAAAILLKWTCLLGAGWIANTALQNKHPRLRVILWRGILCCGLALPFVEFLPLPRFTITIPSPASAPATLMPSPDPVTSGPASISEARRAAVGPAQDGGATPSMSSESLAMPARLGIATSWPRLCFWGWIAGCAFGFCRLLRMQIHRALLRRSAS
ncbi:MAG: hypothetical protein JWN25_1806, partial [Verrucomicrobiales bacterium]|nr:hypothetical protein [Verrucomicrobiales bacterium]